MALLMSHTFRQSIPSIFTASKPTWPDPEQSIGRECSKISGLRCWEVTGPALEIINKLSIPIKEMLDNHQEILEQGELKPRAVSFHMWMIGSVASAANPTIVFSSKSRRQRTYAKVLLKESKLLDNYPGIKIKTLDKAPAIYQAADSNLDINGEEISNNGIYMVDDSRGVCGSLVAFGDSRLATMGGIILIDNVHYGISAQHARFNYTRERQCPTSEPADALCFDDDDGDSEYSDLIETTSRGSISSASNHGYDTESLTSASMPADPIFEPPYASSSVDQVGLEAEDNINTQQDRYSYGQRIANMSSNCIQTDLDYELFRLDDPRFHTDNAISLPTMQESAQMLRPGKPARMPLDAAVWVFTGTTGSVRGTMTSTAHYIKMEGSRTFQEMWAVRLDRETRPGDCGAWVIDALTGSIYGHIIAGDPSSSTAYIIPAYKVFDDIENRFGISPSLPSETAPDSVQNRIVRSSEPAQNSIAAPSLSTAAFNFDDGVCGVRLPRTGPKLPQKCSPWQKYIIRSRVEISSRVEEESCPSSHLQRLPMKASDDSSTRLVDMAATLGQRTRCQPSGTSGSHLLALHTREDYPETSLRDRLLLFDADYNDYKALSYVWGEAVNGTLSKDTENLDFALYPIRGLTNLWIDSACVNRKDWREVHAQLSGTSDTDANATRMKVLLGERAAYSYAPMASVHSDEWMVPAYMEELESQNATTRCNYPVWRVPLRLSSLPSSDSVRLYESRRDFKVIHPDSLRLPRATFHFPRFAARLESSDVESTRFRARINKAARLAYLTACLADFFGDPPQHLNEDVEALASRFEEVLRSRRLSESRAACGDSLGTFQQPGATMGLEYYRRLPIAFMETQNLHVLLDHLSAALSRLGELLKDRRDAMTSSESLQFPLVGAIIGHDANSLVGDHNAAAHFEDALQGFMDWTDGKTAAESLRFLMTESYVFRDALDECQTRVPHRRIWNKNFFYCLVSYVFRLQVLTRTPERLRFFFWWENDSTLQSHHEFEGYEQDPNDS